MLALVTVTRGSFSPQTEWCATLLLTLVLSRHLVRPNPNHINEEKRIIRYLIKNRNFSIKWSANETDRADSTADMLFGAVDASYAACQLTRRSHGGWLMLLNHGAVSRKSGLQPMVTLSSYEAEYVALCSSIVEAKYLRQLLMELGYPQPEPGEAHLGG